jgi:hypothetical protein
MQENEGFHDTIRKFYPIDAELFGTMGATAAAFCADISKHCANKPYVFMDPDVFREIQDPVEMTRIYWAEILFRVHWAARLNLMRHQRWQAGCVAAFTAPANFLGFAASLRGLIESALDASYSFKLVPFTLARDRAHIDSALRGTSQVFVTCPELEDALIHYLYARKTNKQTKGAFPPSHAALEPWQYRSEIQSEEHRKQFEEVYTELCGYCHPTFYSVAWLSEETVEGEVRLKESDDANCITDICRRHHDVIELALSLSVTASALCLKTLNWFSLSEVWSPRLERWNFNDIPAWRKVEALLSGNRTPGAVGQTPI